LGGLQIADHAVVVMGVLFSDVGQQYRERLSGSVSGEVEAQVVLWLEFGLRGLIGCLFALARSGEEIADGAKPAQFSTCGHFESSSCW
jgi:hypothetical protein